MSEYKRIIYTPGEFEPIPEGNVPYYLPLSKYQVIDIIVTTDFTTSVIIHYDSLNGPMLNEPFHHQFANWEVTEEERLAVLNGV